MEREDVRYILNDYERFKTQALNWSQKFQNVVWLDSNKHIDTNTKHESILAVGEYSSLTSNHNGAFEKLKKYQSETNDYIFGYLSYDLKNDTENLLSQNSDNLEFPDLYFFQPEKLLFISPDGVTFKYLKHSKHSVSKDFDEILNSPELIHKQEANNSDIQLRISKDSYLKKVKTILDKIHQGALYEATFCQEFYSENTVINPLSVYKNLNAISNAPFATYLKNGNKYLLSASPERYLKKTGQKVISQPIKGTAPRSSSKKEDAAFKNALRNDPKERAENIMIVDLVRNDLSRISTRGTTKVEELCGIYSFKQVHQMISTVSTETPKELHPVDIIKKTFPMGSMTGAPKISAMEIIEKEEESKRSLFSGSVGYFTPKGDFDLNVVIRSILYNSQKKYVSFSVGSAITSLAIPEKELEECMLKAKAMKEVLI